MKEKPTMRLFWICGMGTRYTTLNAKEDKCIYLTDLIWGCNLVEDTLQNGSGYSGLLIT